MIEVKNLTKIYGDHVAVDDLSFTIEDGKIYGLLGPNGAGKSTTMNVMTGCLSATYGSASVDGLDIFEDADEAKKKIGYLPEIPPLYNECTPYEYLNFVAEAKGIVKAQRKEAVAKVMEQTGITQMQHRLIRNLSKGYKQRTGIAQAILGDPEIIILDEPTVGLDPKQIIEIRDLIHSLAKTHTVILSSHILSEIRAVCDVIMIISEGKLVACDTPENLEMKYADGLTLKIVTKAEDAVLEEIMKGIPEVLAYETEESSGKRTVTVHLSKESSDDPEEKLFTAFAAHQQAIYQMSTETASLEDVFLELTGEKKEKEEEADDSSIQA